MTESENESESENDSTTIRYLTSTSTPCEQHKITIIIHTLSVGVVASGDSKAMIFQECELARRLLELSFCLYLLARPHIFSTVYDPPAPHGGGVPSSGHGSGSQSVSRSVL